MEHIADNFVNHNHCHNHQTGVRGTREGKWDY